MSILRSNGNALTRLRRVHRWVGATLLLFVVFLSVSGIAVNHASDFGLDRKYISWSWLLEAYGMKAPSPYAGMVSLEQLVVVGDGQRVHLLLETGELIESIDLGASLPGDIVRVGSAGGRAILDSGGTLYRSDEDVTLFEPWAEGTEHPISWSSEVDPDTAGLEVRACPARPAQWPNPRLAGSTVTRPGRHCHDHAEHHGSRAFANSRPERQISQLFPTSHYEV